MACHDSNDSLFSRHNMQALVSRVCNESSPPPHGNEQIASPKAIKVIAEIYLFKAILDFNFNVNNCRLRNCLRNNKKILVAALSESFTNRQSS